MDFHPNRAAEVAIAHCPDDEVSVFGSVNLPLDGGSAGATVAAHPKVRDPVNRNPDGCQELVDLVPRVLDILAGLGLDDPIADNGQCQQWDDHVDGT